MQGFASDKGGEFGVGRADADAWGWVRDRLFYQAGDFEDAATYDGVESRVSGNCVFYLASRRAGSSAPC